VVVVLFPLRAEARPFLLKLRGSAVPAIARAGKFKRRDFAFGGRKIAVIIAGTGRSVEALAAAGLVSPSSAVILAGAAKALNPRFNVGDVFVVTSAKREGHPGTASLSCPKGLSLPEASLLTCDRVVFRSDDPADLADMEGYYAAAAFPGLTIIRAVSDRDEDLEFLNECRPGGRFRPGMLLRRMTPKRAAGLVRVRRNVGRAGRKLAEVLWDYLVRGDAAD